MSSQTLAAPRPVQGALATLCCLVVLTATARAQYQVPPQYRAAAPYNSSQGFQPTVRTVAQETPLALPAVPAADGGVGQFAGMAAGNQAAPRGSTLHFDVSQPLQRLEMIVNTSRILTMKGKVPRAQVNNPEILKLQPLSPNEIQIAAKKTGVTQVNLWDEQDRIHTVDVVVFNDAQELEMLLRMEFPNASLRIRPLANSVVLSGYVDRPDDIGRIITMAQDYYPKVHNNITVGGVQQVALKVKIMEVSRTKLRSMGFDWANISGADFIVSGVSGLASIPGTQVGTAVGLGGDTMRFGLVSDGNAFFGFLEALRQYNLVKLLADPTLTTVSGRPATFNAGGEFPILVPQSLGTVSIEYKQFGTRVDFVPIVLGNGNIRLECRPQVSEIDSARGVTINDITVPGLRNRWVDTAVEMRAGQTLALAGLLQQRVESENKGVPWLADLPWAGAAFRRVEETVNEVELLILVTPELVNAMDPHEVPCGGPGTFTTSPNDIDLYWRGYMEVPRCDNGNCAPGEPMSSPGMINLPGNPGIYEGVPAGQPLPEGTPAASYRGPRAGTFHAGPDATPVTYPTGNGSSLGRSSGGTAPRFNGTTNPQNRQNPAAAGAGTGSSGATSTPGLIGPIGYDVLE